MTTPDDALVTVDELVAYMRASGVEPASEGARLAFAVRSGSAAVSTYCDRRFTLTVHTEHYDGPGHELLYLRNWPIVTPLGDVTVSPTDHTVQASSGDTIACGIWESANGVFDAGAKLTERSSTTGQGDYVARADEAGQGLVNRVSLTFAIGRVFAGGDVAAIWPRGTQNVLAVYEAGYAFAAIPANVKYAATRMAAIAYKRAARGLDLTQTETMPASAGAVTALVVEMPDDVKEALARLRKMRIY